MTWDFGGLPFSARTAILSLLTIGVAYLAGQVCRYLVINRLTALARHTAGQWDDEVMRAVGRRVPFWSVLVGIYISADYWVLSPSVASATERVLFVVAGASVTFMISDALVRLVQTHGSGDHSQRRTTITESFVRIVVITLGLVVILNGLGLSIAPILTALGVGGLAIALALQDTLANLFAGFYLTVAKQLRIGNYIRLSSGEEGYLVDIDWRATRLQQLTNTTVLIPNAKLSQSIVSNYNLPDPEVAVVIEVSVGYGSDLDKVERITTEVARDVMNTTPGAVSSFEPFVRFQRFGDPGIDASVILRAREFVDQQVIRHEFVKRLHRRYLEEGIAIPLKSLAPRQDTPPSGTP